MAKNFLIHSSKGKKETTAKSKKYEEELDQPKIKKFENYPHLVKYGAMFPQFKKKELCSRKEFRNLDPLWAKLIDGLTNLDPLCRM